MIRKDIRDLIDEVEKDLEDIMFGSVELYVQNGKVTQKTIRIIKKTGTPIEVGIQQKEPGNPSLENSFTTGNQTHRQNRTKSKISIKLGS